MSLSPPQLSLADGSRFKVGIVAASYNGRLVDGLLDRVGAGLRRAGVRAPNVQIVRVPGSNEVPFAANLVARRRVDVVIALGVLIRGDTIHYGLIADSVAHALQDVALATGCPVINGVIVAENAMQAEERALGEIDRGAEFAQAAIAMAALRRRHRR